VPPRGDCLRDAASDIEGTNPDDAASADIATTDGPSAGDAASLSFESIIAEYRGWHPLAASPQPISAYIFGLCRAPSLREQAFADSVHGQSRYLLDWANPLAAEGLARKGVPAFAAGSVIVKEKLVGSGDGGFSVVGLGIMVKRELGFDRAQGDWDYAYWEERPGLVHTAEQTVHCGDCHVSAQDTDYVFMDVQGWLRDK
jgi:hypothetical protein